MVTRQQMRSAKALRNAKGQKKKFPALLLKVVDTSDIVLQILDSRFIGETRNIKIEEYIKEKKKKILYVLNKSDLVNISLVRKNPKLKEVRPYVFVSSTKRKGGKELRDRIKYLSRKILQEQEHYKRVQVGVIGYPNAGKSSIINLLIGKTSAKTGAEAGFTKGIQKLKLIKDILLLDSPGVIPVEEYSAINTQATTKHTKIGARDYHKIKNPAIVFSQLFKDYSQAFKKHYKIQENDSEKFIEIFGKQKNALMKGGEVDENKASRLILKDWQAGKIKV